MKARIKATGEVVEVQRRYIPSLVGEGYVDEYGGCYPLDEFEELQKKVCDCDVDWQAYRREVAKECAAHLLSTNNPEGGWEIRDIVSMAVETADALIEQLKATEP